MTVMQQVRILPLLVLVASLCLVVRLGEFATGMRGIAFAQQEVNATPPPLPADPAATPASADAAKTAAAPEAVNPKEPDQKPSEAAAAAEAEKFSSSDDTVTKGPDGEPAMPGEGKGEKVEWKDSSEAEFEYSKVKEDIYKDLAARRKQLDKREKDLATREALLEAAERELDQKIREMTAVRNEIEGMMKQQTQEEDTRITSLVKIYEGMKPADAARIFNTLDMDVLIQVMSRMSERKSGPILAEMLPDRARSVTIMLAQQKELPAIPPQ